MADPDFRKEERPPNSKHFAIDNYSLEGASVVEAYDGVEKMKIAKEMLNTCYIYANAYTRTMFQRLKKERPEFFEENKMSEEEMTVHLINNMCIPHGKYR